MINISQFKFLSIVPKLSKENTKNDEKSINNRGVAVASKICIVNVIYDVLFIYF